MENHLGRKIVATALVALSVVSASAAASSPAFAGDDNKPHQQNPRHK